MKCGSFYSTSDDIVLHVSCLQRDDDPRAVLRGAGHVARGERGQTREPGLPAAGRHAGQGEVRWATKRLFEPCTVVSGEGLLTLDVAPVVWLGGLPDMSELAGAQGEAVTLARYKGCIRRVKRLRSVSHIQLELSTNLREVSQ